MTDPFEESLKDLLRQPSVKHDDHACLGRVLKKANRQRGIGLLFDLFGHWLTVLLIGIDKGASNLAARSPSKTETDTAND